MKRLVCLALSTLMFTHLPLAFGQDKESIDVKEVSLDRRVEKPNPLSYVGPGSGAFFLFGAVGGLALQGANLTPSQALQERAEKNGVLIEDIVLDEIISEFKKSGKLVIVGEPEKTDVTMKLSIRVYGFSIPHGFSSRLVPTLSVGCELLGKNGDKIWSDWNSVLPLGNPAESVTAEELKDPEVIRKLWQIAAQAIAKKFSNSF